MPIGCSWPIALSQMPADYGGDGDLAAPCDSGQGSGGEALRGAAGGARRTYHSAGGRVVLSQRDLRRSGWQPVRRDITGWPGVTYKLGCF